MQKAQLNNQNTKGRIGRWLARGFRLLIAVYQRLISPLLPPACIYEPPCSEYGKIAIGRFGVMRGMVLLLLRLLRCNALFRSAVDPVPHYWSWREMLHKYSEYRHNKD